MFALLLLLAPLVALIVWGVAYDIKRRRRGSSTTDYYPDEAARRLRADRSDPMSHIPRTGTPSVGDIFGP